MAVKLPAAPKNSLARMRQFILTLGLLLLGGAALAWTPALNGYPLIHSDSGTYIFSGARLFVPADRPLAYGLFIHYVNLWPSLWGVVALQALATSYLLFRNAQLLLPPMRVRTFIACGIVIATALTTTVSTFVGFISPDILAAWCVLGGVLLFLSKRSFDRALATFLILIALASHYTHLAFGFLALTTCGLLYLALPSWRARLRRPTLILAGLVVLIVTSTLALNYYAKHEWTLARGSATMFLNRLVASGVMRDTLAAFCGEQNWTLCNYQAVLSAPHANNDWFLWSPGSPVEQVGWEKGASEQNAIIGAALRCCLRQLIVSSAQETWQQFWFARSGDHIAYLDEHWNAVQAIRRIYPNDVSAFLHSSQESGNAARISLLPLPEASTQLFFLMTTALCCALGFYFKQYDLAAILLATCSVLVANAILVGTLNGAAGRYQMRLAWLLAYCTYLCAAVFIARRRQRACGASNLLSVC